MEAKALKVHSDLNGDVTPISNRKGVIAVIAVNAFIPKQNAPFAITGRSIHGGGERRQGRKGAVAPPATRTPTLPLPQHPYFDALRKNSRGTRMILRPGQTYTGNTHIRIRWHMRNMMQALAYDGIRRAESVLMYTKLYRDSDHWHTGKLTALIRSKVEKMWRLLERAHNHMQFLDINRHVLFLDSITGLGTEVDHLVEVMEDYVAAGGRVGLKAEWKSKLQAAYKPPIDRRRRLEEALERHDDLKFSPMEMKGMNAGEREVLRLTQLFAGRRPRNARLTPRSRYLQPNKGFDPAEYQDSDI